MPLADLLQGAADAVRTHVTQRGRGGGRDYEAISAILLKDLLTFVPLTRCGKKHAYLLPRARTWPLN